MPFRSKRLGCCGGTLVKANRWTLREKQIGPQRHVNPLFAAFKINCVFNQFEFLDLTGSRLAAGYLEEACFINAGQLSISINGSDCCNGMRTRKRCRVVTLITASHERRPACIPQGPPSQQDRHGQ